MVFRQELYLAPDGTTQVHPGLALWEDWDAAIAAARTATPPVGDYPLDEVRVIDPWADRLERIHGHRRQFGVVNALLPV